MLFIMQLVEWIFLLSSRQAMPCWRWIEYANECNIKSKMQMGIYPSAAGIYKSHFHSKGSDTLLFFPSLSRHLQKLEAENWPVWLYSIIICSVSQLQMYTLVTKLAMNPLEMWVMGDSWMALEMSILLSLSLYKLSLPSQRKQEMGVRIWLGCDQEPGYFVSWQ